MRQIARAAGLAAVGLVLAGCIPAALIPLGQAGLAAGVNVFCSPAAVELRGDVRGALYGDRAATVLSRDDCQ